jgi:taurine dioxygenase
MPLSVRKSYGCKVKVKKAAGAIGAYIDDLNLADGQGLDEVFPELFAALFEHGVIFLREQNITPEAFQSLARRFGEVEGHPAYPVLPTAPDVQILESTAEAPSKIEVWHTDMTFRAQPPAITLLHGQIIPEYGGDTLWASTSAAFADLSAPMREFLAGLSAVHDFRHGFAESLAEPGGRERLQPAIDANPPVTHPVVTRHPESGVQTLYVNALFTTHLVGLSAAESQEILGFLYRHITRNEFTVRLNWELNTVAIWDNRLTQHKPINDFFPQSRKLHRVTIAGERPVA